MEFRLADNYAKPMQEGEVTELLNQPSILRIAMIDARDGTPLVHPVWHYYEDGKFFLTTYAGGAKARSLKKNPDVYFLVDVADKGPPYGVRGKGKARVIDDPEYAKKVISRHIMRYLGSPDSQEAKMLIENAKNYSVIEIAPLYMATWKY